MKLHERFERLWWRRSTPPLLLRLLAMGYRIVMHLHQTARAYRAVTPPIPLISIGNICVGGSGKTPFVVWLSDLLKQEGLHPVILCRGDGGRIRRFKLVEKEDRADLVGDEAKLLAEESGCPVLSGPDRLSAAFQAAAQGDVIILDDGFQYRRLKRVLDIVMIPEARFGNGFLLPAGPLREPIRALNRAHLIVHAGAKPEGLPAHLPCYRWHARSGGVRQIAGPASLPPKTAVAACGIARPQRFFKDLQRLGIEIKAAFPYPDHALFEEKDIVRMTLPGLPVIVTQKDAVKIKPLWPAHVPLWVAELQVEHDKCLPDAILASILSAMETSRRQG